MKSQIKDETNEEGRRQTSQKKNKKRKYGVIRRNELKLLNMIFLFNTIFMYMTKVEECILSVRRYYPAGQIPSHNGHSVCSHIYSWKKI